MYGETFRKAYEKGYQKINPRKRAKNTRLLEEALEFLRGEENTKNPEGTLKALFALYEEIDSKANYIKPSEREFFPVDKSQRTLERFLEGFKYVYSILKRAQERLYLVNVFDNFWEQCRAYLTRSKYSEKFISNACAKDSVFYRQSFNYWRQEFDDSEEGFSVMYEYFKACFGIKGNDEYCLISKGQEAAYDWRRMKTSYEKFNQKRFYSDPVLEPPDYVPPSEDKLEMLRDRIRNNKKELADTATVADALLLQIQKRNRKKGYFQHT